MSKQPDQAEGQRFMTGCSFVLVAAGFILLAFGLGIYSTYRQYKADPEGFEEGLKQEYRIMEEQAQQKAEEEKAKQEAEAAQSTQPD